MKLRKIILLFCILISIGTQAQSEQKAYLGFGTGINNYTGILGPNFNYFINPNMSIQAGVGIGGWGWKYSIGFMYNKNELPGWQFGLGYSQCTGGDNVEVELELENGYKKLVTIDYLSVGNLNLKTSKSWRVGQRNFFFLDLGYAIPLYNKAWKVDSGEELSKASQTALNIVSPGGVILGLGFMFGL